MQFGRSLPTGRDAELPDDDPRTLAVLAAAPRGPLATHAGCPTFANREWLGTIYPADAAGCSNFQIRTPLLKLLLPTVYSCSRHLGSRMPQTS